MGIGIEQRVSCRGHLLRTLCWQATSKGRRYYNNERGIAGDVKTLNNWCAGPWSSSSKWHLISWTRCHTATQLTSLTDNYPGTCQRPDSLIISSDHLLFSSFIIHSLSLVLPLSLSCYPCCSSNLASYPTGSSLVIRC